jgi:hypothetical protein
MLRAFDYWSMSSTEKISTEPTTTRTVRLAAKEYLKHFLLLSSLLIKYNEF